jgi:hypothetical protein
MATGALTRAALTTRQRAARAPRRVAPAREVPGLFPPLASPTSSNTTPPATLQAATPTIQTSGAYSAGPALQAGSSGALRSSPSPVTSVSALPSVPAASVVFTPPYAPVPVPAVLASPSPSGLVSLMQYNPGAVATASFVSQPTAPIAPVMVAPQLQAPTLATPPPPALPAAMVVAPTTTVRKAAG